MKTTIYALGTNKRECYGHGDYGNEVSIRQFGGYSDSAFYPTFATRQLAQEYLDQIPYHGDMVIVPLELIS